MKLSNKIALENAIRDLEIKKVRQEEELLDQYKSVKESLRPANLVKQSLGGLLEKNDMKSGLLKTLAGVAVGVLSKNMLGPRVPMAVKGLAGQLVETFVSKKALSQTDKIKAYGKSIYKNVFRGKSGRQHNGHE